MDTDGPEDLEAILATDAEIDAIAAGGPGGDDPVARMLVAWRDAGRKGEPMQIDYSNVALADLYVRMTPDGMLFLGVGTTTTPNSPGELDDPVPRDVLGVLLTPQQRRELAHQLLAVDDS